MFDFKTEQEKFWAGEFGNQYIKRNQNNNLIASNIALFASVLKNTINIDSVIEFGANIGYNLLAIQQLLPTVELSAIEINSQAVESLRRIKEIKVYKSL